MYYDFNTSKFIKTKGLGLNLAITSTGEPLMVLENGEIFLRKDGELVKINGFAKNLSIAQDGHVWIISGESANGGFEVHKGLIDENTLQVDWHS